MRHAIMIVIGTVIFLSAKSPVKPAGKQVLSEVSYSLTNRYHDPFVNDVFADNILLTLAYMTGKVKKGEKIVWSKIKSAGSDRLILKPGQTFAFHDTTLKKYEGRVAFTTNAHFNSNEGFKSDGWLVGDGVCHLASFIYVVSQKAGLQSEAPTSHDFAVITDVPKQSGVSIFYSPDDPGSSTLQNLYITNNREKTIAFIFTYNKKALYIRIEQFN